MLLHHNGGQFCSNPAGGWGWGWGTTPNNGGLPVALNTIPNFRKHRLSGGCPKIARRATSWTFDGFPATLPDVFSHSVGSLAIFACVSKTGEPQNGGGALLCALSIAIHCYVAHESKRVLLRRYGDKVQVALWIVVWGSWNLPWRCQPVGSCSLCG